MSLHQHLFLYLCELLLYLAQESFTEKKPSTFIALELFGSDSEF